MNGESEWSARTYAQETFEFPASGWRAHEREGGVRVEVRRDRVPELLDSEQNFRPTELRIRANCLVSRKRDLARNVLSRVTRRERAHYTMAVCNHLYIHDSSSYLTM